MLKGFQTHYLLREVSFENPFYLIHTGGHAGFANAKAMDIAGLQNLANEGIKNYELEGGEVIVEAFVRPTGIFNERAQSLIRKHIPKKTSETEAQAFKLAVEACHKTGITSFHDAGIPRETIPLYEKMKLEDNMNTRIYAMLTGWDKELLN